MSDLDHSLSRKAKDIFSGFVGGAVQVLVGQPFDLVKVRMQTGKAPQSMYQVVTRALKNEGISAFYRGTSAPLLGVGACVSIQFYAFHETKRQLAPWSATNSGIYTSGAIAGLVNTVVTAPVEHVRILMQVPTTATPKYTGAIDAAKTIFREHGLVKLYRGGVVTALREVQAYGTWFLTYELLIRSQTRRGIARSEIPTWKLMMFGALAGEALWVASYPLDVVKSQVQSDAIVGGRYRGAWDAARQTYLRAGIRGFFVGITPTLLRALPASACTFASVELTMRALG